MNKRFSILLVILSMTTLLSCSDNERTNDSVSVVTGKAGYSGITEVDWANNGFEILHFDSVDPDDWRDDGFLKRCLFIPNPFSYDKEANIRVVLDKSSTVTCILRDFNGMLIPFISLKDKNGAELKIYPFFDKYISEKDSSYKAYNTFSLSISRENKEFTRLEAGIYRLFIYAYSNSLMREMLRDTGTTNAQRESYSMVYGDILIK